MHKAAWEVWFYPPSGGRKLIDRFNTRNEAECHRAKLGRLIGNPSLLTVCFDPPQIDPLNFYHADNEPPISHFINIDNFDQIARSAPTSRSL